MSLSRSVRDSDGASAFDAMSNDQREREEIERSLDLLETLYATAPVGLAFIDTELRFQRVNERLAATHGIPAEAHIGRTLTEVLGVLAQELEPLYRRVLEERRPVSLEFEERTTLDSEVARHWHVEYVPVQVDGRMMGVNAVVHDVTERKRSEARAAFLARASQMLVSSLDYRDTLQRMARLVVPEIADWCSISVLTPRGEMYRVAIAHHDPEKDRIAQALIEFDALPLDAPAGAAHVAQAAETQVIDDFSDGLLSESLRDPRSQEIIRRLGIGSLISVPLIARGRTLGAISLVGERRARFRKEDVEMAEELARRASVSIDNARMYTEHARIAHTLQAGLLPRSLPQIPGLELAARYRPAGELIEVGGDFYDVYLRGPDEWLVVIGDVTGKGAEAAATTALVRYTLRAAAQHPGSPSQLLRELNGAMIAQQADYCTIGLVRVRSHASGPTEMTVCLGGHPSPMLLSPEGDARPVGAPGTMLGFVQDASFTETEVSLRDGEILVLYTDGLTEAAPPGWSEEQLAEQLSACPAAELDGLLGRLEAMALEDAHGEPRDDIALLAMRRAPAVASQ